MHSRLVQAMAPDQSQFLAADEYISSDSSLYGSTPSSPSLDPDAYFEYQNRVPAALVAQHIPSSKVPKGANNPFQGRPAIGRQSSESVTDFVARLPPSKTFNSKDADGESWIWCVNTRADHDWQGDVGTLVREGREALLTFEERKSTLAAELDRKGQGQDLNRKLAAPKAQLTEQIKQLARQNEMKSGKWMLFCTPRDVDKNWERVCEGTVQGRLGFAAKVLRRYTSKHGRAADGETNGKKEEQVVCVYTEDFEIEDDVRRVLEGLRDLGLVSIHNQKGIWYKADAWTLLEINNGNEYGLRASLYGSREMLSHKGKS